VKKLFLIELDKHSGELLKLEEKLKIYLLNLLPKLLNYCSIISNKRLINKHKSGNSTV